jgi:tRNA(Ile)-lysidine synthase
MDLFYRTGYPVVVAHFDHGIRPESKQDARFVERVAQSYNVPFILGKAHVPRYAEEHNLSIEEASRIKRYQFLFEQAEKNACQTVAVAHNADDQAETLLMHLLRGSGMDGLTGMAFHTFPNPWSNTIPLARPLLNTWRTDIEEYCTSRGLKYLLDRTNLDSRYFRNRIRNELIPELETYIPGLHKRLWQTADLLQGDQNLLEEITQKEWSVNVAQKDSGFLALRLPDFNRLPLAIKRRVVRKAIYEIRPNARDVDYAIVNRVIRFVEKPTKTKKTDIGLGLKVLLEEGLLFITTWEGELPSDEWPQLKEESPLELPGELELQKGWKIQAVVLSNQKGAKENAIKNSDLYQAWIELPHQKASLLIRSRKPGDVFKPLGMGGKKMKLSDFMINLKIPCRVRNRWPLICVGDEIAWVPGYRIAHTFRLGGKKRSKVVHLRLYHHKDI